MKKILSLACAGLLCAAFLGSCCSMTRVTGISSNTPIGSKEGVSKQYTYLGVFGKGGPSHSIKSAAQNGNIKTITHTEERIKSYFLGFVVKNEIHVYGE